jgi:hypothetical protein
MHTRKDNLPICRIYYLRQRHAASALGDGIHSVQQAIESGVLGSSSSGVISCYFFYWISFEARFQKKY